jgi:L-fucose mutarotase/ribose pyranase (RbsD/FucU family)
VSFLEEIHATQNPLQMASGYKVNRVVDGLEHLNKSGVESLIFFLIQKSDTILRILETSFSNHWLRNNNKKDGFVCKLKTFAFFKRKRSFAILVITNYSKHYGLVCLSCSFWLLAVGFLLLIFIINF